MSCESSSKYRYVMKSCVRVFASLRSTSVFWYKVKQQEGCKTSTQKEPQCYFMVSIDLKVLKILLPHDVLHDMSSVCESRLGFSPKLSKLSSSPALE